MTDSNGDMLRILEAVLFASAAPRTARQLARHLPGSPETAHVKDLLATLQAQYRGRGVELRHVGEGWAFRTAEDLAGRLHIEQVQVRKLSRAAVETLAIIAYQQPVTRGDIEEIRGVGLSKGTLDTLLEAGWVRPAGRRETPGRPLTWATTDGFLDHFGLTSHRDLPAMEELKAAGLLDARPALTALSARGDLAEVAADSDDAVEENSPDNADALDADFGEDLIPPDTDICRR